MVIKVKLFTKEFEVLPLFWSGQVCVCPASSVFKTCRWDCIHKIEMLLNCAAPV